MHILLSRTDSIGDTVLTLPLAGVIKNLLPQAKIDYLGRTYTRDVVNCSSYIDDFLNWDEIASLNAAGQIDQLNSRQYDACIHVFPSRNIAALAKKCRIPVRVGTYGRLYHWMNCNHLVRFSRRKSTLHESQLNLKLLKPLGIDFTCSMDEMTGFAGFSRIPKLDEPFDKMLEDGKYHLILHPKSKGSAVEWPMSNFKELIELIPEDRFRIFITGTENDGEAIRDQFPVAKSNVVDLTGRMSLEQLIAFISNCHGMVAASTGPLHLAGIMDKIAIGLYSPRRPIHPGRWHPLGKNSVAVVYDENCPDCRKGRLCNCIERISPQRVYDEISRRFQSSS